MTRAPHLLVDDETPARTLAIGEIAIGQSARQQFRFHSPARQAFAQVANDHAPVHDDDRFARDRGFDGRIIQGLCVASRFSRLIGMYLPGQGAILESIGFKFRRPVYEGAALLYRAAVVRVLPTMRVVRLRLSVECGEVACVTGEAQCLLR